MNGQIAAACFWIAGPVLLANLLTSFLPAAEPQRGIGQVLIDHNRIPLKVVAARDDVWLVDRRGTRLAEMKLQKPYFVFDEKGDRLLVDEFQDRDLARSWVDRRDIMFWPTRRLVYPKPDGQLAAAWRLALADAPLQPLDATRTLPWPLTAGSGGEGEHILADFRPLDGSITPIRLADRTALADFDVYVIYSQTEIKNALKDLVFLQTALNTGQHAHITKMLDLFLTQNSIDFLDLTDLQKVVDTYPDRPADYSLARAFEADVKRLSQWTSKQVAWLRDVQSTAAVWDDQVHVLPAERLWDAAPGRSRRTAAGSAMSAAPPEVHRP